MTHISNTIHGYMIQTQDPGYSTLPVTLQKQALWLDQGKEASLSKHSSSQTSLHHTPIPIPFSSVNEVSLLFSPVSLNLIALDIVQHQHIEAILIYQGWIGEI